MSSVAKRYARAAVSAAQETEGDAGIEKLAHSVRAFHQVYTQSTELRELLANPALKATRDATLGAILTKVGVSKTAARLIQLIAQRDRIPLLGEIADGIEADADERAGRMRARVRSAMPLSDGHMSRLSKALEKRFKRPVTLSVSVEPELLGGLVCQVGDLTLDSSLRRQLEVLREQLAVAS